MGAEQPNESWVPKSRMPVLLPVRNGHHAELGCTDPVGPSGRGVYGHNGERAAAHGFAGTAKVSDVNASGPSVALFTYAFDNYREEFTRFPNLRGKLSTIYGWHRDRYIFIDAATFSKHPEKVTSIRSDGWVVCVIPDNYIPEMAVPRTTMGRKMSPGWDLTKYLKFGHVPAVLSSYDYIYHLDASVFKRVDPSRIMSRCEYTVHMKDGLKAFLARRSGVGLVLTRHLTRNFAAEEWATTISLGKDNQSHIGRFKCAMTRFFGKHGVDEAPNFGMGQWIRSPHDARANKAFVETWRALKMFGIKRDQNVFGFALWYALGSDCATRVAVCSSNYKRCGAATAPPTIRLHSQHLFAPCATSMTQ